MAKAKAGRKNYQRFTGVNTKGSTVMSKKKEVDVRGMGLKSRLLANPQKMMKFKSPAMGYK